MKFRLSFFNTDDKPLHGMNVDVASFRVAMLWAANEIPKHCTKAIVMLAKEEMAKAPASMQRRGPPSRR